MSVLIAIYWFILIVVFGVGFAPDPWPNYARKVEVVLFIILGLKMFGVPS